MRHRMEFSASASITPGDSAPLPRGSDLRSILIPSDLLAGCLRERILSARHFVVSIESCGDFSVRTRVALCELTQQLPALGFGLLVLA